MKSKPELEPLTDVIFRRWRNWKGIGSNVLALFPMLPYDSAGDCCVSYTHIGQHGRASYYLCIQATTPVAESDPDVQALKRELESPPYGYRLRVLKRSPPWRKVLDARRATLQGN